MIRVLFVIGTRPEGIKLAPLILAMRDDDRFSCTVLATGQHARMLDVVLSDFGIRPDRNLRIHADGHTLEDIWARTMSGVADHLNRERFDVVVVQGDTSGAAAAALAAFHRRVAVAHLEAGLRTGSPYAPFPEEMNRRLLARLASLHLAPTTAARDNLLGEGVDQHSICLTGNTVVDALQRIVRDSPSGFPADLVPGFAQYVLVTTHRRETWGEPLEEIVGAVAAVADERPTTGFFVAMHPNPTVRASWAAVGAARPNLLLSDSVDYSDMARLIAACTFVLTDSGGIQEEAPSFGKPVLVLREKTERMEGVLAGTAQLVGTSRPRIEAGIRALLDGGEIYERMSRTANPYGDGRAAARSLAALAEFFGCGTRLPDFSPGLISDDS